LEVELKTYQKERALSLHSELMCAAVVGIKKICCSDETLFYLTAMCASEVLQKAHNERRIFTFRKAFINKFLAALCDAALPFYPSTPSSMNVVSRQCETAKKLEST
jgi:hypothetical protein